jgi:hypothetical protein
VFAVRCAHCIQVRTLEQFWESLYEEKACSSFLEEVHCFHGFSDCPYCFKINMNIGAGSPSFSDYLVTDFGIHVLFKNVYGMRMANLCVFEVLCK